MIHRPTFESSEWNLCAHANKHAATHTHTHARWILLLSGQSLWVNNFDIRHSIPSFVCVCVCAKRKGGGEKVISSRLVYVLVIYTLSAVYIPGNILTFQKLPCHFRNNWPVSCAEPTPRPVDSFFFFFPPHATELPKRSASLSLPPFLLLLTMCQHVHVSNNNNKTVLCEWLRSHFGLASHETHYSEIQQGAHTQSGLCGACGARSKH